MASLFTDAFGEPLRIGDEVFFAGSDQRRKPTINKGSIEDINAVLGKVMIRREQRSGNAVLDSVSRVLWVEITKVGVVPS